MFYSNITQYSRTCPNQLTIIYTNLFNDIKYINEVIFIPVIIIYLCLKIWKAQKKDDK